MAFLTDKEVLDMALTPKGVLDLLKRRLAALDVVYAHFPAESVLASCARKKYAALRMSVLTLEDGIQQQRNQQLENLHRGYRTTN